MTNRANLARQLVAYALAHPHTGVPLLEYLALKVLHQPSPPTTAIAALIPEPKTTMGAALIASLTTFEQELKTQAPTTGAK
jgi:hypothetical protein